MRSTVLLLGMAAWLALSGCAGPERKLGRGFNNVTEFTRLGEIQRSVEQTALWDGPGNAATTGFIRGVNRSLARTAIGAYEIVTFPLPPYGPLLTSNKLFPDTSVKTRGGNWGGLVLPENPVYPASYQPGLFSDSVFANDNALGFSSGDVAPMVPGSRFRIFDH